MNRRAIAALALAAFAVACGSPLQKAANRLIEEVRLGDPLANQTYSENEELLLSAEAVPIWTDALENSDSPQVQAWAAEMLGAIGDESTLPVLAAAMAGNRDVRDAASDAIRQFSDEQAGGAFVMALETGNRDAEATALAQISRLGTPEAVDVVAGIAGRGDALISRSALVTLGDIGTPSAADALVALASNADIDAEYRRQAVLNLGRIEGAAAQIDAVIAALEASEDEASAELLAEARALR